MRSHFWQSRPVFAPGEYYLARRLQQHSSSGSVGGREQSRVSIDRTRHTCRKCVEPAVTTDVWVRYTINVIVYVKHGAVWLFSPFMRLLLLSLSLLVITIALASLFTRQRAEKKTHPLHNRRQTSFQGRTILNHSAISLVEHRSPVNTYRCGVMLTFLFVLPPSSRKTCFCSQEAK